MVSDFSYAFKVGFEEGVRILYLSTLTKVSISLLSFVSAENAVEAKHY